MSRTDYKEKWVPWILFLTIAVIYLLFPTKNYYWDGIAFAQTIEDAPGINSSLIHPNHLLYNVIGYVWYRLVRGVGIDIRAVHALQILNGLLAAVCTLVLFQILKRALRSSYLSLALTLLFAFSATWWKFATDADSYILSVLFLLISFYLIFPGNKAGPFLVALTFSVSMCFHQLAVIFYPVIVLGLFLQSSAGRQKQRFMTPLYFSLLALAITFTAYCYCYYLITGTLDFGKFIHWITSFSTDVSFSFDARSNLFYSLRGHWRLFFGGRFNAIKGLLNPFIVLLMIGLAAVLVTFLYKLLRSFGKPDLQWVGLLKTDRQLRSLLMLSALWTAAYFVFLFVWLPQNTFYRLFYLPALILMVGLILAARERAHPQQRRYRLALFIVIVSLFNFLFLIFPYSHAQKYPPLAFALEMSHVWPRGTVIYYDMPNSDNSLVRYFNSTTTWRQLPTDPGVLEREVGDVYARGVTAWLEASAIDQLSTTPDGAQWLSRHAREESRHALVNKAYNLRFIQVVPVRQ